LAANSAEGSLDIGRVSVRGAFSIGKQRGKAMQIKPTTVAGVTIADQPTEGELRALKGQGYTGVVNLRNDGEPEQPLSPAEEGNKVREMGLDYLHYGVGGAPLSAEGVASVSEFLTRHASGKVLVHCRKGARAAALVLLHEARARNWGPDEAVARGRELGLDIDGGLRMMVENYLRTQSAGGQ
jgi:uncharacterized protein (TIGR01244 family)